MVSPFRALLNAVVCVSSTICWLPVRAQPSPPSSEISGSAQLTLLGFTDADGLRYDHVLLTGGSATVDPATGTIARTFFLDRNGDIVAVDYSGAGKITFSFESYVGPAAAALYNQSTHYIQGHAAITIVGSDATSKLRIFTLGRTTVTDQTIFRSDVTYDGIADLQKVSVVVVDSGQIGSIDAGNVRFSGTSGVAGIAASGVDVTAAVSIHDIKAEQTAVPAIRLGSTPELRVLGGDLSQPNGRSITVSGFNQVNMLEGVTSHGVILPARALLGIFGLGAIQTAIAVSPGTATFRVGTAGSYAVPGFGSPAPSFSLVSGTLPGWANLDSATGVISGTPSSTAGSPFTFAVRVSNGSGTPGTVNLTLTVEPAPAVAPAFVSQPVAAAVTIGGQLTLSATASGTPVPSYQWRWNGSNLSGATQSTLQLADFGPEDAGYYSVVAANAAGSVESARVFVGVASPAKVAGVAEEVGSDIVHSNGNRYDQVLLKGASALMKSQDGDIIRISFIDLSDDIVQVEFSGAGTLSLSLGGITGPARPALYNQPVEYVRGHARIVITDANETTHLTVFTVGRATAVNQSLFQEGVDYDGVADIASISISTTDGKFGGLRAANASFANTDGWVGIYAPGVAFGGPVFVGDIAASGTATPMLVLGSAADVRITGGDLDQPNGRAVAVKGITALQFRNGSTSHGEILPAQANKGRLEQDGVDVTNQIAQAPAP